MINLLGTIFRVIFSLIDRLLIVIINGSYSLLIKLASFSLIDSNTVKAFNQRIGVILGIFMLFTLAIQLLNYIISPDKFSDKSKGGAKLISNIIVSLFLLATINFIFETAYKVQFKILEKQLIPQLIFGARQENSTLSDQGKEVSFYLYSSMVDINDDFKKYCPDIYYKGIDPNCDKFLEQNLDQDDYNSFKLAILNKDASRLLNVGNITAKSNGEFIFDYIYIFSTVISVITILILLGFCIDASVRIVKLYFLQVIAPVPIISNMIPGKGQEFFKKWYKACFSTFLDLFIRLVALFFATYIITIAWGTLKGTLHDHFLLGVFVILGALLFAKQVPQLVQDLTGFKMDGAFSLNPLKKFDNNPFIGGISGGIAGSVLGAVNSSQAAGLVDKSRILHGAQGFFTGGARGMMQGSHEKNLPGAIRKGADYSTVGAKKILATKDTTPIGRNLTKIQRRARMKTKSEAIEEQLASYDKVIKGFDNLDSVAGRELDKVANSTVISAFDYKDRNGMVQHYAGGSETLGQMKARLEQMKNGDIAATPEQISDLESMYNQLYKNEKNIMKATWKGKYDRKEKLDADIVSAIHNIQSELEENDSYYGAIEIDGVDHGRIDISYDADKIKATTEAIKKRRYEVDASEDAKHARANTKYADETRSPRPGPMGPMGNKKS